ncbi:MAG: metal ABC transporter solute-binding protein, Zn/Mn family [Thiomonas sp.]
MRHPLVRVVQALVFGLLLAGVAQAAPVSIVAAESTYGVIAQAIGGDKVAVDSIIRNPNVDPHSFEATPAVARKVARAQIVLLNGLGYDDWMDKMLAASPAPNRQVIHAAQLDPMLILPDKNPHVFYDPQVALLVAQRLAAVLQRIAPADAALFARNLQAFKADLARLTQAQAALRKAYPGLRVTATEPVVGYLLRQLGWTSLGEKFQFDVMNDTEPSPAEVARYEDNLRQHKVTLLFYNRQVNDPLTNRLRALAQASGVPVVGVDEFVPPDTGYVQWQLQTVRAIQQALGKSR